MSFRGFKCKGLPVVRIGGVPYVLDMARKQLRAVHDPSDTVDLEEDLAGVEAEEGA